MEAWVDRPIRSSTLGHLPILAHLIVTWKCTPPSRVSARPKPIGIGFGIASIDLFWYRYPVSEWAKNSRYFFMFKSTEIKYLFHNSI